MDTADTDKTRAGIQSVEVGFALLEALAVARGPLMLRDLGAAAGMSPAKAHRYLVSFQRLGLVIQDSSSNQYDLGPAALKLGLASLSRLDAVKMARERVTPLMEEIRQTLAVAVWGNHGPVIVHWEESPEAVTVNLRLGDVMPLLSSATGRCFAAYFELQKPEAITTLLQEELDRAVRMKLPAVPASMDAAKAMLAETRERGIGRVVDSLLQGISGLCAPVFDSDGHLVLGIVSMGSNGVFDANWDGEMAKALKRFASKLSSDLGYPG